MAPPRPKFSNEHTGQRSAQALRYPPPCERRSVSESPTTSTRQFGFSAFTELGGTAASSSAGGCGASLSAFSSRTPKLAVVPVVLASSGRGSGVALMGCRWQPIAKSRQQRCVSRPIITIAFRHTHPSTLGTQQGEPVLLHSLAWCKVRRHSLPSMEWRSPEFSRSASSTRFLRSSCGTLTFLVR